MSNPNQYRGVNFRCNGQLYLVRCFHCEPVGGRENVATYVALGTCAWCGWSDTDDWGRETTLMREAHVGPEE